MMMFCFKIHEIQDDVVLAICDKGLVGKRLRDDPEFVVSEGFYHGEEAAEKDLDGLFEMATIGNLVGKVIVDIGIKKRLITKENVIMIGDIPHAQFVK
jgi:hypothetical protein